MIWDSEVVEFVGGGDPEALIGLDIRNKRTGETRRVEVEGAFVAIGHEPATELFKGQLDLDADNYIRVEVGTTKTSVPGVFACGDVMDGVPTGRDRRRNRLHGRPRRQRNISPRRSSRRSPPSRSQR